MTNKATKEKISQKSYIISEWRIISQITRRCYIFSLYLFWSLYKIVYRRAVCSFTTLFTKQTFLLLKNHNFFSSLISTTLSAWSRVCVNLWKALKQKTTLWSQNSFVNDWSSPAEAKITVERNLDIFRFFSRHIKFSASCINMSNIASKIVMLKLGRPRTLIFRYSDNFHFDVSHQQTW